MTTKEIPGFPHYLARSDGRILSLRRNGRVMNSGEDHLGYKRQPLVRADGKTVCCYVHRLVALAFLPIPAGADLEVDHIDGNPRNNAVENLRWVTHRANIVAAIDRRGGNWLGRRGGTPIIRITPGTGEVTKFASIKAAVEDYNRAMVANGGIAKPYALLAGNICHARDLRRLAYGYFWCSPRKRLARAAILASIAGVEMELP